jgi:hypothetical protein
MQDNEGRNFFDNLRRTVKISYLVASIIPLLLLIYFSVKYVYPYLSGGDYAQFPLHVGILLLLAVVISLLGLSLSTKATNTSISSIQNLYGRLHTLLDTTKQLRETQYLDVLLESIVKSAIKLNNAETGSILLYDESGVLRFRVVVGEKSHEMQNRTVKRGEGISGWVADIGQTAVINNVSNDKRYNPGIDKEIGFTTKSIMCVPLIYNEEIIGAIEILNKKGGSFSQEDERLLQGLADQAALSIARAQLFESKQSDMIHLTEILVEAQDFHSEKHGHARRVANYANLIGKKMGLSDTDLKNLHYASLLHDIGFIKTKAHDIVKSTAWEKEMYLKHPQLGYEMIKAISVWRYSAELILNHHERHDGTGYPSGRKKDEIPLGARILSVANVFDVLTSKHSYRQPLNFHDAMNEIEQHSGAQFDPDIVNAFKESIRDSDLFNE